MRYRLLSYPPRPMRSSLTGPIRSIPVPTRDPSYLDLAPLLTADPAPGLIRLEARAGGRHVLRTYLIEGRTVAATLESPPIVRAGRYHVVVELWSAHDPYRPVAVHRERNPRNAAPREAHRRAQEMRKAIQQTALPWARIVVGAISDGVGVAYMRAGVMQTNQPLHEPWPGDEYQLIAYASDGRQIGRVRGRGDPVPEVRALAAHPEAHRIALRHHGRRRAHDGMWFLRPDEHEWSGGIVPTEPPAHLLPPSGTPVRANGSSPPWDERPPPHLVRRQISPRARLMLRYLTSPDHDGGPIPRTVLVDGTMVDRDNDALHQIYMLGLAKRRKVRGRWEWSPTDAAMQCLQGEEDE